MSHLELETRNTAITGAGRGDISGNLNSCGIVAARTDELITSHTVTPIAASNLSYIVKSEVAETKMCRGGQLTLISWT